jgi:hypothetical protein
VTSGRTSFRNWLRIVGPNGVAHLAYPTDPPGQSVCSAVTRSHAPTGTRPGDRFDFYDVGVTLPAGIEACVICQSMSGKHKR